MSLAVIGAGFGRTGTESMKLALEQLGFGPCHHMKEVLPRPAQVAFWQAAVAGEPIEWDDGLADFASAVDWPSAHFWRELSVRYPEAKILLTLRSAESWYESFSRTILPTVTDDDHPAMRLPRALIEQVFEGRAHEREHAIGVYERNTAEVQASIPDERLLTYQIGDGWGPLCAFLGVPEPAEPFPHTNTADDFHQAVARFRAEGPPH